MFRDIETTIFDPASVFLNFLYRVYLLCCYFRKLRKSRLQFLSVSFYVPENFWSQPGGLLLADDKALANRRVFGCGQECLSSVLVSYFFVSKAACSSAILLVSLCCSPSYSVLWVTTNCCLSFVTQSVHFRYPRSCLRSNIFHCGSETRWQAFGAVSWDFAPQTRLQAGYTRPSKKTDSVTVSMGGSRNSLAGVTVSAWFIETMLAGWVSDFICVCLETRWMGQKTWILCPGTLLYPSFPKNKCSSTVSIIHEVHSKKAF